MKQQTNRTARSTFIRLSLLLALLLGAVLSTGCAVHASPYGIYAHPVRVRLVAPPPPPVAHRCSSYRMCNIWGVCSTRTVCNG